MDSFCDSIVLRFFGIHFWEAIVFLDNPYYQVLALNDYRLIGNETGYYHFVL